MDLRERLAQLETRLGVRSRTREAIPASTNESTRSESIRGQMIQSEAPPTLSDRLKRLVSAQSGLPPRRTVSQQELARLLGGELCADGVVLVDHFVPLCEAHGCILLSDINGAPLDFLAGGTAPPRSQLLFIDTETTGLAGGTGTVAFVLGLARIDDGAVHVRQYFLTSFAAETAMLEHALGWIQESSHLVSFNGKSFDIPLLVARYRLARLRNPLAHLPHMDLLHRTRTAFRKNWPDCKLQTAEQYLLKLHRHDDMPGYLMPQIWADLLKRGETRGLRGVIEHNRTDVISLVALAIVLGRAYAAPGQRYVDPLGVARAHRRSGDAASAMMHLREYDQALEEDAQLELAMLYARQADWGQASTIWQALTERNVLAAMEPLAKYLEHKQRDYRGALALTERMTAMEYRVDLCSSRRKRLLRKIGVPIPPRG